MTGHSYFHRTGGAPLVGETIGEMLRTVSARLPDEEAIVSIPQGLRIRYAELDERVDALARGLLALGVEKGDRVGIWSTDNAEWIVLQLATARVGAILVNVNPGYRTEELRHALRLARVQCLFHVPAFRHSDYEAMLRELLPGAADGAPGEPPSGDLPDLKHLVVFEPEHAERTARRGGAVLAWQDVLARGASVERERLAAREAELDFDDPINIQFTSGTTGLPKAVLLTHHNILNNARLVAEAMRFTHEDRLCVPVPFYHCFGMVVSNLACLAHGATIVVPAPHFEAGATLAAIEAERCTAVHGVPTMFVEELECADFSAYDLSSLRTGIMAGAPCPPELVRRVMEEMGCPEILIGYGQTEASPVTHLTLASDPLERRVDTVGLGLPHLEVKVVDVGTGALVPVGEQGEVCFRGYQVMRGYFGQAEATGRALDAAGWLHSGDLGVLDADGYLRITGRLKDMIIRGGENVYPAEIEAFYYRHPKVAQIAVFGVPDPRLGEEVGAWIELKEGETADPEEFREWAKGRIAHFKIPRYVWLVDEFPLTITGKIQKFRIREIVERWSRERTTQTAGKREEVLG